MRMDTDTALDLEAMVWEEPPRPRPTMKTPERSRFWWFWRMWGFLVWAPLRYLWSRYTDQGYFGGKKWRWRYPSAIRVHRWVGNSRSLRLKLSDLNFACPHCGDAGFEDEKIIYDQEDPTGFRRIELFELVEGGGLD